MTTGFLSVGIIDPQGSVVATTYSQTIPADTEAGTPEQNVTAWSGLELFDEYGNTLTNAQDTSTGAISYAWLGGKERATDTTGLVLMGVRLYNSVTGHFTSVDPVKGGNTTAYAYPQDPINKYDLDGNAWGWAKKAWKGIQKAGKFLTTNKYAKKILSACSWVPGAVGTACNTITAVAHAVNGDFRSAASMVIGRGVGKGINKAGKHYEKKWSRGVAKTNRIDVKTAAGKTEMVNYQTNYRKVVGRHSWLWENVTSMGAADRMKKKKVFW